MTDITGQALIEAFFTALARRELEQCQALLRQLSMLPNFATWATYLEGILVFETQGDFARAEQIFVQLLPTNLDPQLHGRVLVALGRTLDVQGRWQEAVARYQQALPIFATLDQPLEQIKVSKNIAATYQKGFAQGDLDVNVLVLALDHCQQAFAILDDITPATDEVMWLRHTLWNTQGTICLSLNRLDDALDAYQQSIKLSHPTNDHHVLGIYQLNLGEVYHQQGEWPAALDAYQQAYERIHLSGDHQMEADILANLGFLYEEMGDIDHALHYYDQAITTIEMVRTQISTTAARADYFATTIHSYYAKAILLCIQAGHVERAFLYVEQARARAFLDLVAADPTEDEIAYRPISPTILSDVQAQLSDDALILEYFTTGLITNPTDRYEQDKRRGRHRFPAEKTVLFVISNQQIQLFDLDLSPNRLLPRRVDMVVERHFLEERMLRLLYTKLLEPAEAMLADKEVVYFIPHGPLHYVPFHALLDLNGGPLLHEQKPCLVYAPSTTVLLQPRKQVEAANATCLAIGYNGSGDAELHFAEAEAERIAQLVDGVALSGTQAKKSTLLQDAPAYRMIHLSCHGQFEPTDPLNSTLHLGQDETLTAREIMHHARLNCDVVTLSACETGLSEIRRGDELIGLSRAFMHAGTPAVVATLWRVDERSTRLLMERFYQEVQNGTDLPTALKRAQLFLRNLSAADAESVLKTPLNLTKSTSAAANIEASVDPSHQATPEQPFAAPFYWAPFVLILGSGWLATDPS